MKNILIVLAACVAASCPSIATADLAREMRKTVGFMVVEVATIRTTQEIPNGGGHLIVFNDGRVFAIKPLLFLPPLPLTDTVLFGRIRNNDPNQVEALLLIDKEVHPAILLKK
jgi:hypothetical protein